MSNKYICHICQYTSDNSSDYHSFWHMSSIIPNLFLGSKQNAYSLTELRYFDIQTIINVAKEIERVCSDEYKYIKYDWDDFEFSDILTDLDKVVDELHNEIIRGRPVLVHCAKGISRSASAVIAYLIKYKSMNYDDAYKCVKEMRSCINPNPGFVEQLKEYAERLHKMDD